MAESKKITEADLLTTLDGGESIPLGIENGTTAVRTTTGHIRKFTRFQEVASLPTDGLLPNVCYKITDIGDATITLAQEESGILNEYMLDFTTGTTAPTITFPNDWTWPQDAPTIEASKHYQISIVNKIALYVKV